MKIIAITIAVFAVPALAVSVSDEIEISVWETLYGISVISILGGLAASSRDIEVGMDWRRALLGTVKTVMNTLVFGVSLGLFLFWAVPGDDWRYRAAAIGLCGFGSLGGLAIVDWAHGMFQRWVEQKVKIEVEHAKAEADHERDEAKGRIKQRFDDIERERDR